MRNLTLAAVTALLILFTGSAVAVPYECKNQFGDKVFTNVPKKPSWICVDPSSPTAPIKTFEKLNDGCVPEVLSSCQVLKPDPSSDSITQNPFVSLSCVIDNAVAPDYRGAPISVLYNEQNNAAIVNDQQATHVSITEATLYFRWGSTTQGIIKIDRLSGRFQMGADQNQVLATGRCDRVTKRRF